MSDGSPVWPQPGSVFRIQVGGPLISQRHRTRKLFHEHATLAFIGSTPYSDIDHCTQPPHLPAPLYQAPEDRGHRPLLTVFPEHCR